MVSLAKKIAYHMSHKHFGYSGVHTDFSKHFKVGILSQKLLLCKVQTNALNVKLNNSGFGSDSIRKAKNKLFLPQNTVCFS